MESAHPDWQIEVIDNFSTGKRQNLHAFNGRIIECDLLDEVQLVSVVKGKDAVIHLAALGSVPRSVKSPRQTFDNNVVGTELLLEGLRENPDTYLVFASSSSVYGANPNNPRIEKDYLAPLSPYAASKISGEALVQGFSSSYGISSLIFRFFNVYGPHQDPISEYAAVIPKFIHASLDNHPIEIFGDGSQTRDFTYVGSVVEAIIEAVESRSVASGPLNLAWGTQISVSELALMISEVTGRKVPIHYLNARIGEVKNSQANPDEFLKLFPNVVPTNIREGLRETVAWVGTGSQSNWGVQ